MNDRDRYKCTDRLDGRRYRIFYSRSDWYYVYQPEGFPNLKPYKINPRTVVMATANQRHSGCPPHGVWNNRKMASMRNTEEPELVATFCKHEGYNTTTGKKKWVSLKPSIINFNTRFTNFFSFIFEKRN